MKSAFCLIFISVLGSCHVAPATPFGDAFKLGTEQSYTYVNDVSIGNNKNAGYTVGYRVTGDVNVGSVWGNDEHKLLTFQLTSPELHAKEYKTNDVYSQEDSPLDSVVNKPFYAYWNLGYIKKVYFDKKEDASILNLKKGIISLFQYQLLDGNYVEEDVSGTCDVAYVSHSTTRYHKAKHNCRSKDAFYHERNDEALGTSLKISRDTELFVTTEGCIERIESQEYFKYSVNAFDHAGGFLESTATLKVSGEVDETDVLKGDKIDDVVKGLKLKEQGLETDAIESLNEATVIKLIKEHKKSLANDQIGKKGSSLALLNMIPVGRRTKSEDFIRVFKAKSMHEYKSQLCDLLGAIQTEESHKGAKEVIDFKSEDDLEYTERYLQALAVGTRPKKSVILDLLSLLEADFENKKAYDTLVQTVASMANRFAILKGDSYENETVEKVTDYVLKKLEKCPKDKCKLVYIRALQNLRSPKTVEVLLKNASQGSYAVSVSAMKALRSYPTSIWNKEIKSKFEGIFFQTTKKFDSSARALALDILLEMNPDYEETKRFVHFLASNDKSYEVKQYLIQKLRMLSEECPKFTENFSKIVKSDPKLNNYHVIGVRGLSTALQRQFSTYPSFNGSLISLQEMNNGVLKRGIVDLTMEVQNQKVSLFQLGMYAGGLSSFVGSSEEVDPDEDSTPTAGMELYVQGSFLRPLQFFRGQGELMGHVWSGTASEPTPAYQATTLLQDSEQKIKLQNGVTVNLSAFGAMSIDLNGQVTFSLWNRNAKSRVEQNSAIALIGKIEIETSYISLGTEFIVTQEPQLHLTSDLDFSDGNVLCMQLTQPDTLLSQKVINKQRIPTTKYNNEFIQTITHKLPGYTHALNQKNNEMCSKIFES